MISIKTIALAIFVGLLALGADANKKLTLDEIAELKQENDKHSSLRQANHISRNLQESSGIYKIINGAVDLAEQVTILCTSSAVSEPAVKEFCDRAF